MQEIPALTLSQLTTMVGNAVRRDAALRDVWVVAELMDVRSSGGHLYMELIEKDSRGATVAKLRANMWANKVPFMRAKFLQATGRELGSGLRVMIRGQVSHHILYGLSFNITDLDPSYTLGDLERLRREILMQLQREGVLEQNRHLTLPPALQKIAVISAAGAAGYGDFVDQLDSSAEGFRFYPLLFGAVMQGDRTAASVVEALDRIEMSLDFWDAVVIIRGGGSTSDLNGFDNLELARRVATFPLPVIVGIGHERDRTVLDEIAAVRCKTPTAVAAWLIDRCRQALGAAQNLSREISRFASSRLEGDRRLLDSLQSMLPLHVGRATSRQGMKLSGLGAGVASACRSVVERNNRRIAEIVAAMPTATSARVMAAERTLKHLDQMVSVLSPTNTLKRGYSVTRYNGKAVSDATLLPEGAEITTTLFQGEVKSTVIIHK